MFPLSIHSSDLTFVIVVLSIPLVALLILLVKKPRAALAAIVGGVVAVTCFTVMSLAGITRRGAITPEDAVKGILIVLVISALFGTLVAYGMYGAFNKNRDQQREKDQT